jgi:hypothetical protein
MEKTLLALLGGIEGKASQPQHDISEEWYLAHIVMAGKADRSVQRTHEQWCVHDTTMVANCDNRTISGDAILVMEKSSGSQSCQQLSRNQ